MKNLDCIFCKIAAHEIPSVSVYESPNVLAFLDISPMEKGHLLILPKHHWKNLADVTFTNADDWDCYQELAYIVRVCTKAVLAELADGANILQNNNACAGQTVDHLHFHVIPRYNGGCVPMRFASGDGAYADDAERDAIAAKLRNAIRQIVDAEGMYDMEFLAR